MKELLIAFIVATLGKTTAEATKLVENEEAISSGSLLTDLKNEHQRLVNKAKEENTNNGERKARKEVLTKLENEVKEKFGIQSDKQGLELIEAVIESVKPNPEKPESVTEDVIKKHPLFLAKERELTEKDKAHKAEIAEIQNGYANAETFKEVAALALSDFDSRNPVLSADATKAAKQKSLITRELQAKGYTFQKQGENDYLILDKEGKRVDNGHGHPLKVSDLVTSISEDLGFEFKAAEERSSTGKKNPNGGGAGNTEKKYTGPKPATAADYMKLVSDDSLTLEQRNEIATDYGKEFGG